VDECLVSSSPAQAARRGLPVDALFRHRLTQDVRASPKGVTAPNRSKRPLFVALVAPSGWLRCRPSSAASGGGRSNGPGKHSLERRSEAGSSAPGRGSTCDPCRAGSRALSNGPDFPLTSACSRCLLRLFAQAQWARQPGAPSAAGVATRSAPRWACSKMRVDKDLSLYAGNLEEDAQAVS